MQYLDFHTHSLGLQSDVLSIQQLDFGAEMVSVANVRYSVGIHPWQVTSGEDWKERIQWVENRLSCFDVLAVGECGLDFLYNENKEDQIECFQEMVRLSEACKKPMIIHCVKAFNQLIELHDQLRPKQLWAIHQFRGKPQLADQLLKRGIYLSFSFAYNKDAFKTTFLNLLFLETDDHEKEISLLYDQAAVDKKLPLLAIQTAIWNNYKRFFSIQKEGFTFRKE